MSTRCVTFEIKTRPDGALGIAITTTTGLTFERCGLASHADAREALEDLRIILAAQGLSLIQAKGSVLA